MTEKELQAHIIELARWHGWRIHHDLPALDTRGNWRTHIQGNPGFPDLLIAHPQRGVIAAELKSPAGKITKDQALWLAALEDQTIDAYLWQPKDLKEIEHRLANYRG
jgi:hypothetical protein